MKAEKHNIQTASRCTPRLGLASAVFCCCAVLLFCLAASASEPTLDDLLDLEPTPAQTQPQPAEATEPGSAEAGPAEGAEGGDTTDEADELARKIKEMREKTAADYKEAANALEEAVQQMDDVSKRLAEAHDPSLPTQRIQEDIIRKLDQMIAAAKQQQQQQSSSSSSSSSSSNSDSQAQQQAQQSSGSSSGSSSQPNGNQAHQGGVSPGSVSKIGDTQKPLEELKREWGQLPPRLRDELSEGLGERFSPVYRQLTEAYYRRLAEEAGER